jgi:hypothetical protein
MLCEAEPIHIQDLGWVIRTLPVPAPQALASEVQRAVPGFGWERRQLETGPWVEWATSAGVSRLHGLSSD